jgi:hypothetical protein
VMPQSSDLARPHESAAPQSTDIGEHVWDASSVPLADVSNRSKGPLFDHLVGAGEQTCRHVEAERFSGLEIEHEIVFGRCLHREVSSFLALEDTIDVVGSLPEWFNRVRPI